MDVNQLRCVVALAEEANFSRAAQRLGVAQPSLSQLIKKMESHAGCRLFDRLPKRVVPTQAGERLVAQARLILAHVADAERLLGESSGAVTGPVAIGVIPTIAPFLLAGVLGELSRRYPDVRPTVVEDVTDRLIAMLERGEIDIAIISSHPGSRTVHVEPVAQERLLLMVPAGHPLARRRNGVTWDDLARQRVLVLPDMHCLSGQVARVCRLHGLKPPLVMRGAQLSTVAAVVCAGLGVSIVPEMMRPTAAADPNCVLVPITNEPPTREIAVAWSLVRYRTNASRALVDIVRRLAAGKRRRPRL